MTTLPSNPSRNSRAAGAMILMGLAYPLLAHAAVLSGRPGLVAASIGWLVVLTLLPGLRRRSLAAWAALAAASVGLYAIAGSAAAPRLLFLPPVLIIGCMAWVFGHTLRRGRTPLIESIIRALNGPQDSLNEEIIGYARRLTGVWTGLLVVLAVINAALALCADPGGLLLTFGVQPVVTVPLSLWSLFANVLNYLLVAGLFVGEFMFRRRRFPQQPYGGLLDFTRRVAGLGTMFRDQSTTSPPDSTRDGARPAAGGQPR